MSVYYGVVKDNAVILPEGVHLAEGLTVEVRLLPSEQSQHQQQQPTEELFKQRLVASGLLKEIKVPALAQLTEKRTSIHVKGKPLSQEVIEARR